MCFKVKHGTVFIYTPAAHDPPVFSALSLGNFNIHLGTQWTQNITDLQTSKNNYKHFSRKIAIRFFSSICAALMCAYCQALHTFCTDFILFWQVFNNFSQRKMLTYATEILEFSVLSVCYICLFSQYVDGFKLIKNWSTHNKYASFHTY